MSLAETHLVSVINPDLLNHLDRLAVNVAGWVVLLFSCVGECEMRDIKISVCQHQPAAPS